MAVTEWVVEDASNLDGHPYAKTVLYDGKDAYSDKTKDDYIAEGYDVLSDEEFDDYIRRVEENMCGHWSEITKEQYYDALDVLAPVTYKDGGFYISEATTGRVHAYYQEFSGKYYTCSQRTGTPREDIMNSLKDFISSQSKEKDTPER